MKLYSNMGYSPYQQVSINRSENHQPQGIFSPPPSQALKSLAPVPRGRNFGEVFPPAASWFNSPKSWKKSPVMCCLVDGWTNPSEKYYIVKMGSSSPNLGVNIKQHLSCHHPAINSLLCVTECGSQLLFVASRNPSLLRAPLGWKNPPRFWLRNIR